MVLCLAGKWRRFNNSLIRPGTALNAFYTNPALLGGVLMMGERLYGNEREVINQWTNGPSGQSRELLFRIKEQTSCRREVANH